MKVACFADWLVGGVKETEPFRGLGTGFPGMEQHNPLNVGTEFEGQPSARAKGQFRASD